MDKFITEIRKSMQNISVGSKVYFSDKRYDSIKFSDEYFHKIPEKPDKDPKIVFIDGGNAEIFSSAHISLSTIRLCAVVFQNNKKQKVIRESFSLLISCRLDETLFYDAKIFGRSRIDKSDLYLSATDATIRTGIHRANISSVANVARRFSEVSLAKDSIKELNLKQGDIILLDGTLQSSFTNEHKYLQALYEEAEKAGVIIAALAKTSTLITDSGNSAQLSILSLAKAKEPWYYYPVVNISHPDHQAKLFFAKLHEKSQYIFRVEIYNKSTFDADNLFSSLTKNSSDPVFLGYPYGLIVADKLARVSDYELSTIRSRFRMLLGKDAKEFLNAESTKDAHSILDNIR